MKLFSSFWTVGFLALVLNVGTTAYLIYSQRETFSVMEQVPENTAPPPKLWSFKSDEIEQLVTELKAEKQKLETRETDIGKLSAQLQTEKTELEKVRDDIKAMREEMSKAIPEVQEAEVKNLKTLSQTYSTLTPQAAVAIFREMDEQMSVKILSMMKTDKVGAILQEMARQQDKDENMAKRAARISDKLRLLKPLKKETPA